MDEQTQTLEPGSALDGNWRERLEQAIDGVLGPIRRAPKRADGEALYSLPWFLFCGDGPAASAQLLDGLADSAPVAIQGDAAAEGSLWNWRFFGDSVGVSVAPAVVEGRHSTAGEAFTAMLDLLRRKRPLMPLNGIVLTVSAGALARPSRDLALRLRALADQTMQTLDLTLPVYLVVTGMDELPGFGDFVTALPAACHGQVMGHRLPEAALTGAEAAVAFGQALDGMEARSRELMLTLIRDARPEAARGIFQFVHGFARTGQGLRSFVGSLTADSALQRRPVWRGLYVTGAAGGRPVLLADLSRRFLPTDQPIARRA